MEDLEKRRRENIPFDPYHFEKLAQSGAVKTPEETFNYIFQSNHWAADASASGQGSDHVQTSNIATELPKLLQKYQVKTFLDLPCGDFNWMKDIQEDIGSVKYIGGDIVKEIIEKNQKIYTSESRTFQHLNLLESDLPQAELILTRDCLVHFSFAHVFQALRNIKRNGIKYLLVTTFPEAPNNAEITTGDWRVVNFEKAPFNFPPPLAVINEGCTEGDNIFIDKSLGLWEVACLPI